jgi:hypothetical protein
MSDTFFPNDKASALALLFIEKQDTSTLSPAELLDKYDRVHKEISDRMLRKGQAASKSAAQASKKASAPAAAPAPAPKEAEPSSSGVSGFTFS